MVSTLTTMKVILSTQSYFILLSYFTCCSWAWPVASPSVYRRTTNNAIDSNSNYIPFTSNIVSNYESSFDYPQQQQQQQQQQQPQQETYYNTQWDRAKEPLNYYDVLDDYWMNQPSVSADADQTYNNLAELFDPPVWGTIVKEKPETELEELKLEEREREASAPYNNQYYYDYAPQKRGHVVSKPSISSTTDKNIGPTTTTIPPTTKSIGTLPPKVAKLLHQQPGQMEIPMLRPPIKVNQHHHNEEDNVEAHNVEEPVIAVAQPIAVAEKPSAYDTLRKYLSLEDALKKEAEKRTSSNRVQKRAAKQKVGNKKIITDVETLSGQLSNLKKSMT